MTENDITEDLQISTANILAEFNLLYEQYGLTVSLPNRNTLPLIEHH